MATGFLHLNVCHPTLAAATAAHWSQNPVAVVPSSNSQITNVLWSGTAWQIKKYTLTGGGVLQLDTTTTLPALSFPQCETSQEFLDGMAVGWGVAAAIIAAWVVKNLRRGL